MMAEVPSVSRFENEFTKSPKCVRRIVKNKCSGEIAADEIQTGLPVNTLEDGVRRFFDAGQRAHVSSSPSISPAISNFSCSDICCLPPILEDAHGALKGMVQTRDRGHQGALARGGNRSPPMANVCPLRYCDPAGRPVP
jgi:hypothetical protein